MAQLVPKVLTAIKEPSTKGEPRPTILRRFEQKALFNDCGDPELKKMFAAAQRFAASVNYTAPYWLTLAGTSGAGKTHLAKAVWRQWMDQNRFDIGFDAPAQRTYGNTGMFIRWRELCSDLRSGCYEGIEDIIKEWFVVFDDVGSEQDNTGFIASATDRIFAGRVGKWTMITTNLTLQEIADRIDVRVADRMLRNDGVVVEVNCPSYMMRAK